MLSVLTEASVDQVFVVGDGGVKGCCVPAHPEDARAGIEVDVLPQCRVNFSRMQMVCFDCLGLTLAVLQDPTRRCQTLYDGSDHPSDRGTVPPYR